MPASVKCLPSCLACLSTAVCTSCRTGYRLLADKSCSSVSCGLRTFYNTEKLSCQSCPYDCLTCSSRLTCLSCSGSDYRQLDLSTNRCIPISMYFDNRTTVCVACPANCLVCRSLALCTVCVTGAFMSVIDNLCYA